MREEKGRLSKKHPRVTFKISLQISGKQSVPCIHDTVEKSY
jgi:hypothetical protein